MYTKQALRDLGVGAADFTAAQKEALDRDGFYIVPDVLSPDQCRAMAEAFEALHASEAERGGHEVHVEPGARRVSNIFNKSDAFDACLELGPVLAASHYLLGEFKLHGANLRDPNKGYGHQQYHADVPKFFPDDWWVLNAIVLFDDMTLENGPTRVVPGSHHWAPINIPVINQGDWEPTELSEEDKARLPADLNAPYPNEVYVTARAGSVVIINSSLWHSGTLKKDDAHRRVCHLTYTRRDLPQQLIQVDYLTRELYDRMSPAHRFLLEIEPGASGDGVKRPPKRDHAGWWN
ncbi:phytanoyl-CoA dioxygenase family protein [Ensifer soli]|uniref:phytanoyl-CoA dioxygenase family protein n=1 Tax=Ciceribacter sp. sgz301302 TaxID=3342379 RepID=UPI0035B73736